VHKPDGGAVMDGFDDQVAKNLGSAGRFRERERRFVQSGKVFPKFRHWFWWIVHNALAHGMLVAPCRFTFWFHDWTSKRLNWPTRRRR